MKRKVILKGLAAGLALIALYLWAMTHRSSMAGREFHEAFESVGLGVTAEEIQRKMGMHADETALDSPPLSGDFRKRPQSQMVFSDSASRLTAVFYLDRRRKVVCSSLLGPMAY